MPAPRTSFLLPVRDGESTLEAAITSICCQTDPDFELLIVDDNSSDQTLSLSQSVDDSRIRVLINPGNGLVDALNFGLEQARGTYIARMDADDRAVSNRLERQLPYFQEPSLGVLDGQVEFFTTHGPVPRGMNIYGSWVNSVITPEDFDRELLVESPVVHPAATYRRDVVQAIGGYRDGPFPEDYDLWLRLHAAGFRLQKVPETLVHMRDHADRLTRTDPRYNRAGFRLVRQEWLASTQLTEPKRIVLFGSGKESGPWLRWLKDHGHTVTAIVDVAPDRIGRQRLGVPIISIQQLQDVDADFGLFLVSARGARQHVRPALKQLKPDWVEGRDWWAVR